MKLKVICALLLLLPVAGTGHHSLSATFHTSQIIEIEGIVTEYQFRNPHIRIVVQESGEQAETWEIESHSVSILRRMDLGADLFEPGDRVRLAGHPGIRDDNEMFALHALVDGVEVVLDPGSAPRWSLSTVGGPGTWVAPEVEGEAQAGIFRVWSTVLTDPGSFPLLPEGFVPNFDIYSYPLTTAARATVAAFDPLTDTPTLDCAPKGMPTIMEQPYPLEFVRDGNDIALRIEEYDTVRNIRMNQPQAGDDVPRSLQGYSTGRWDSDTLIVETSRISWPHFDTVGIPLGQDASIVERFTPDPDGSRLQYQITVTDPDTFTEPVTLDKYWLAVPGISVQPYECTN